ncbi:hypothetical protein QFC21_006307 [Naganishia friedmannii]|uniref:Uncharacterized protein n=1 Tax=Naganishia friedmannii TaxID=89922 RepID=A0ACC2V3T7_9TREE|nr:hypothetical protein QFC21_006307 [Naganishia friedmannii]
MAVLQSADPPGIAHKKQAKRPRLSQSERPGHVQVKSGRKRGGSPTTHFGGSGSDTAHPQKTTKRLKHGIEANIEDQQARWAEVGSKLEAYPNGSPTPTIEDDTLYSQGIQVASMVNRKYTTPSATSSATSTVADSSLYPDHTSSSIHPEGDFHSQLTGKSSPLEPSVS